MANAERRSCAGAAGEFASKGYCSSKNLWYYCVKVRILRIRPTGTLPPADFIGVTPAGDHDLNAFQQISPFLPLKKSSYVFNQK